MKKIVLVCSHLYSGSSVLCDALNNHPRIQGFQFGKQNPYTSPLGLLNLSNKPHKMNNRSAIYMDELLKNQELSTKAAYKNCKFIYVVREPGPVLDFMVSNDRIKPIFAARYYSFRLRRLCEMAKRTPGAVLVTWEDLLTTRFLPMIEDYLELKQSINYDPQCLSSLQRTFSSDLVGASLRSDAESSHEKYLYFLKSQEIQHWT